MVNLNQKKSVSSGNYIYCILFIKLIWREESEAVMLVTNIPELCENSYLKPTGVKGSCWTLDQASDILEKLAFRRVSRWCKLKLWMLDSSENLAPNLLSLKFSEPDGCQEAIVNSWKPFQSKQNGKTPNLGLNSPLCRTLSSTMRCFNMLVLCWERLLMLMREQT